MKSQRIAPAELAWTAQQPVVGRPGVTRLSAALEEAGLKPVRLEIVDDRETIDFVLARTEAARRWGEGQTLRLLIRIFRASGFQIGFSELGIGDFNEQTLFGSTLCGPVDRICEKGGIQIEP